MMKEECYFFYHKTKLKDMTPIEVLKMLKMKIEAARLRNVNYLIETRDIKDINKALLLYDVMPSVSDGCIHEEILINIYGKGADLSDKSRQSNLTIGMVIYAMEQAKNLQQSPVIGSLPITEVENCENCNNLPGNDL